MTAKDHNDQYLTSISERQKLLAQIIATDDINVIHMNIIKCLPKEIYEQYESEVSKIIVLCNAPDPRFPDRKNAIKMIYMEILKKYIPSNTEDDPVDCPWCHQIIDSSSTDCSGCGRVVAGVNVHLESAYEDDLLTTSHADEKFQAFIKRLNAYCLRDVASANLTDEMLMAIRKSIEENNPSYCHADVMKRPLVNHERPGTSVNMLIDAICKLRYSKLYSHIELICHKLWGWEFYHIDEALYHEIVDTYSHLRESINSIPKEEVILIHQNNMLYIVLSLVFQKNNIAFDIKRENFKVPRDPCRQSDCDKFFKKVITLAGFRMCALR